MSRRVELDKKKNEKYIPTIDEPSSDKPQLLSIHWLISASDPNSPIVKVTRTETSRCIGEVSGGKLGRRTAATVSHNEEFMSISADSLSGEFLTALDVLAPTRIRNRLVKAEILTATTPAAK